MARSKIGFHTASGGTKQGLGKWELKLNKAGQAFGLKAADEYGPLHEALRLGRENGVENWLGFRFTRSSGISREVPDYDVDPKVDAPILCQEVLDRLPPEFDKAVWLELINEPRAQNKGVDTMFGDMNACDYLGEWCLAAAKFLNERGYKFMGPSFNSGEPGREDFPIEDAVVQYSQPGMINYLRYCAAHPDQAALSVHEYSWSHWKDGQTAADWYPSLWGRFEAAIAAADLHGIPRTFAIFVTEFGFAHNEAPAGKSAHPYLDDRNRMTARWPQLKFDASWSLQEGWGKVDTHVNTWLDYDASKEFDEGPQPTVTHVSFGSTLPGAEPSEPLLPDDGEEEEAESPAGPGPEPAEPGATIREHFRLAYTGFGVKDVGPDKGSWFDIGNVQVPIIDGQEMRYWEAKGANPFGDGQPWNDFGSPEGVHRWDALLPAHEHFLLNDQGRCYHLFAPSKAWWVRFANKVQLQPGAYRLTLDLWGDWVDIVDGKKAPKPDPGHARVELFLDKAGRKEWQRPEYAGRSILQRTFTVQEAGEYDTGFGILTVFAPGSKPGANGCFLRSFALEQIEATETVEGPGKKRPSTVTRPGAGDGRSGRLPGPGEVSRQSIVLSPRSDAKSLRLEIKRREGNQWRLQRSFSQPLDSETRLDIVFMRGAAEPGQDDGETISESDPESREEGAPETPAEPPPSTRALETGMNINPDAKHGNPIDSDILKGLDWVRYPFKLSARPNPAERGDLDKAFAQYDQIVDKYAQKGVNSLIILNQETVGENPPWEFKEGGVVTHPYSDEKSDWQEYAGRFADVARKIAAHYRDAGHAEHVAYQIWNEGDKKDNPASAYLKPQHMAIILDEAQKAIRQEAPQAKIIFNGMATGPGETVDYLKKVKATLNGRLPVDAVGIHPYTRWATRPPFPDWGVQFGTLSDAFKEYRAHFPDIPFWITEIGVAADNEIGHEHYAAIADYMQDVYTHVAEAHSDLVEVLIWFAWSDEMRNAGIVDRQGRRKEHVFKVFEGVRDRAVF